MKFMDMIVWGNKVECFKCNNSFKRSEINNVTVGEKVYPVCKKCSWDLECWLHERPTKKPTSLPLEVVDVEKVKGEVEKKEGAE